MLIEDDSYECPLCNRCHKKEFMTIHHLYPSTEKEDKIDGEIAYVCLTCHRVIHFCHTNQELREIYNNIDVLKISKKIRRMVDLYKYKSGNCTFKIKKLKKMLQCA